MSNLTNVIQFRASQEEYLALCHYANAHDLSLAQAARRKYLGVSANNTLKILVDFVPARDLPELKVWLLSHGVHAPDCPWNGHCRAPRGNSRNGICDCGWDATLEALAEAEGGENG